MHINQNYYTHLTMLWQDNSLQKWVTNHGISIMISLDAAAGSLENTPM